MSRSPSDGKLPQEKIKDDAVDGDSLKHFPERRGSSIFRGFFSKLFLGDPQVQVSKCERNVIDAIDNAPFVKLLLSALKTHGCEVDYRRHFSCELCSKDVTGGYDPSLNQIVICSNRCGKRMTQGVLAHELLHMYDYCRAHLDFNNLEHVACTEIRAANLMHCSILSGMFAGSVSLTNLNKAHQRCVKQKAVASVIAVRPNLEKKVAWDVVNKVFDKCYNDLEPIGRRVRRSSRDMERAYRERFHYGYYD